MAGILKVSDGSWHALPAAHCRKASASLMVVIMGYENFMDKRQKTANTGHAGLADIYRLYAAADAS
jgi:hypothetical protein